MMWYWWALIIYLTIGFLIATPTIVEEIGPSKPNEQTKLWEQAGITATIVCVIDVIIFWPAWLPQIIIEHYK